MKKIYLFMLLAALLFSLNSCSNDNNSGSSGSSISMKVGGVQKTFNTVTVSQEPYTQDGINYVDLIITASNNGNAAETVTFGIGKGDVGADNSWGFSYTINEVIYSEGVSTVSTNATTNTDKKLVGTFSGTVTSSNNASLELTQGTFDISY